MRNFHNDGTLPTINDVFVFGSNLAGRHGAGDAKVAMQFGAIYGVGSGRTGNSYGIPTKDKFILTLPLEQIRVSVDEFIKYAITNSAETFFVTRIGCGLAGYSDSEIAPMFKNSTTNCSFPYEWKQYI